MADFTELADAAALRCAAGNVRDPERRASALRELNRLNARVAELEAALSVRDEALAQPPDAAQHPVYTSVAEHVAGIAALLLLDGRARDAELVSGVVPRVAELGTRVAELERENERLQECARASVWAEKALKDDADAERDVSKARLAALEWLRDQGVAVQGDSEPVYWPDIDDDQPALEFWENLSAAVGREVGPREGEQG